MELNDSQIEDEVVADYAGKLLQNDGTLERFIESAQGKPTLLQRIAQVFRDLVNKLRGTEKAQAERTLGKLEKMAPGNEEMQIAILDQSIENGWQGVYPLKTENWNGKRDNDKPRQYREAEKALEMIKQYESGGEDAEGFEWPDSLKDR